MTSAHYCRSIVALCISLFAISNTCKGCIQPEDWQPDWQQANHIYFGTLSDLPDETSSGTLIVDCVIKGDSNPKTTVEIAADDIQCMNLEEEHDKCGTFILLEFSSGMVLSRLPNDDTFSRLNDIEGANVDNPDCGTGKAERAYMKSMNGIALTKKDKPPCKNYYEWMMETWET